jgi:hypothetical protein
MTMQTVELTTSQISEDELVLGWRIEQLRKTGYPAPESKRTPAGPAVVRPSSGRDGRGRDAERRPRAGR